MKKNKKNKEKKLKPEEKIIETDDINLALIRGRIYERNLKIINLYKNQLDDMEWFQELVVRSGDREDINSFIIDIKDAVGFA